MELEISSPKPGGLTQSDCNSDPDEKEVSNDDDDDQNHKHRRRDTRSQSLERDVPDPVFTRPFRKQNKPFPNGNHFRERVSQTGAAWKNYNSNLDKDFFGKFDTRPPGHASTAHSTLDLNKRFRPNQPFPGDPGLARGRGRDLGLWNQRDSRFGLDLACQVVQGSIPPSLFAGRGLPSVSNAQNAPLNAFGLIPGIPNGNLDAIHSIGLQGPLRPQIPSTLNMGIPRQRCRGFEGCGFCLRGDMCPMGHGVNPIVIEGVQSLSQFNLPVSLPSAHLLGPTGGPGPGSLASISSSSVVSINNKGLHSKSSRPGLADDGLGLNGSYSGSGCVAGADLYDPYQPLWNNSGPETSNALLGLQPTKIDETESTMNGDSLDNEFPVRSMCMRDVDKLTQTQSQSYLMLLSGPPSSGKTSLLFQFALNSAAALETNNAVFICNRRNLEANPPFLSQAIDPSSSDTFERIQMKYVDDDEGINNYFAAFHLHDTFPSTVVIDDFSDFFHQRRCKERHANSPRGRELAMVRTLALCHNAIMHANETKPCNLVLSDTHHGDSPRFLFIYKRWISTIFTITGDGSGSFTLKSDGNEENGRLAKTANYSIALQYLVLHGIENS